jgi:hypothetical protein
MATVLVRRNTEQTRSIGISIWGNDHHRQVPTKSRKTDANVCPSSFRRWNTHHRGGLGAPSLGGQVTLMFTARRSVGGDSRECLGRHDSAQRTQGGRVFSAQDFKTEKTRYDMFPDMFCPKKSHIESLGSGPPLPYVVCQYNIRWWWSVQPMNGESSSYLRLIGSMYLLWRTKPGYVGA